MNTFRHKLATFLLGRYGLDQMYYGLLVCYVVLVVVQCFVDSIVLSALSAVIIVYAFWRVFSKNHAARRRENHLFLRFWRPFRTELVLTKDRFRDSKNIRYRHCRHCRAILKLPRKKGSHTVICPQCHKRFSVHILF